MPAVFRISSSIFSSCGKLPCSMKKLSSSLTCSSLSPWSCALDQKQDEALFLVVIIGKPVMKSRFIDASQHHSCQQRNVGNADSQKPIPTPAAAEASVFPAPDSRRLSREAFSGTSDPLSHLPHTAGCCFFFPAPLLGRSFHNDTGSLFKNQGKGLRKSRLQRSPEVCPESCPAKNDSEEILSVPGSLPEISLPASLISPVQPEPDLFLQTVS